MPTNLAAGVQEVSAPLSALPSSPLGRSPGGSPFEAALDGAVPLSARLRSTPRTYSEAGDLSPRHSMGIMWQEVEEITCSLVAHYWFWERASLALCQVLCSFEVKLTAPKHIGIQY